MEGITIIKARKESLYSVFGDWLENEVLSKGTKVQVVNVIGFFSYIEIHYKEINPKAVQAVPKKKVVVTGPIEDDTLAVTLFGGEEHLEESGDG
jgi:hypothetical protein